MGLSERLMCAAGVGAQARNANDRQAVARQLPDSPPPPLRAKALAGGVAPLSRSTCVAYPVSCALW